MDEKIDEMAKTMCFQRDSCPVKSCVGVNCEKTWLAEALYNAGYRKESDTAKEICDLILEYWKVDAFVDCSWVIEVISEKYGVDLD